MREKPLIAQERKSAPTSTRSLRTSEYMQISEPAASRSGEAIHEVTLPAHCVVGEHGSCPNCGSRKTVYQLCTSSPTNIYAKQPLQAAVMLSGDFEFYASDHKGCWNVHVLSLPVISAKSKRMGYAISHTVTDPKGMEVGHALTFGPDNDIFVKAMHKAAADAIRNIRLARSSSQSDAAMH